MFNLIDTKIRIECMLSRQLQNKVFKEVFSKEEFEKTKNLYEELKKTNISSNSKIELVDLGDKIIFNEIK